MSPPSERVTRRRRPRLMVVDKRRALTSEWKQFARHSARTMPVLIHQLKDPNRVAEACVRFVVAAPLSGKRGALKWFRPMGFNIAMGYFCRLAVRTVLSNPSPITREVLLKLVAENLEVFEFSRSVTSIVHEQFSSTEKMQLFRSLKTFVDPRQERYAEIRYAAIRIIGIFAQHDPSVQKLARILFVENLMHDPSPKVNKRLLYELSLFGSREDQRRFLKHWASKSGPLQNHAESLLEAHRETDFLFRE